MACRKMSTPLRLVVVVAALASASMATSNLDDIHERPPVQTVWQYHGAGHRLYGSRRLTSSGNSPYGSNGDDAVVKNISTFNEATLVQSIKNSLGDAAKNAVVKTEYKVKVEMKFPAGTAITDAQQTDLKNKLASSLQGVDPEDITLSITTARRLQAGEVKVTAEIKADTQSVAAAVTTKASNAAEMKQMAAAATSIDAAKISSEPPTTFVTAVLELPASSTVDKLEAALQGRLVCRLRKPCMRCAPRRICRRVPDGTELPQQTVPHEFLSVFVLAAIAGAAITMFVKISRKKPIEAKFLLG